jgi:hypothetical protein
MYNLTGQNFINRIRSFYPKLKEASGKTEVICRCPFCGDSRDPKHAHLYISVPRSEEELSFYDCKKCPAHGVVDIDFLRKIGCEDTSLLVEVSKHNAEVMSLPKYRSIKQIDIYPLNAGYVREDLLNMAKLKYINDRIGSNFSISDLASLKIFLNLYDIINTNNLELTRHQLTCNDLDKWFIGFISYDNSYAGLRKLTNRELHKAINKRYINYTLVNKKDDAKNFYVIPTTIDIFNPAPVKIHLAEGQFDILSIFYNLNNCNRNQNIYIACGGKSYSQALEFILLETGIINYEVHYYPDKDVTDQDFFYDVQMKVQLLPANIIIHRNMYPGEKDFGVPMSKITDSVRVIHESQIY